MKPLAVDAMGGDHAPDEIVKGVALFLRQHSDLPVLLVGDEGRIKALVEAEGLSGSDAVSVRHASEVIEMHEKLATARRRKDSSLLRAVEAVKEGDASALVGLGNTMAVVALTHLKWGLLEGVERAGIAVPLPNRDSMTVVIDMGANVSAKPEHLRDYAVMASIYTEKVLGKPSPRVGLLNVGEESGKGAHSTREAYSLLGKAPINFKGNAEGRDIFSGEFDVVVCDGFAGNVALKAAEGAAELLVARIREALSATPIRKIGAWLSRNAFRELRQLVSYASYGGAPLLGVDGVCIIGHGRSDAKAVANALRVAREAVRAGLPRLLSESLASGPGTKDSDPPSPPEGGRTEESKVG